MSSPFPGMNPYLEQPELWSEVHSCAIVAAAIAIEPELNPNYRVAVEKRIYSTSGYYEAQFYSYPFPVLTFGTICVRE